MAILVGALALAAISLTRIYRGGDAGPVLAVATVLFLGFIFLLERRADRGRREAAAASSAWGSSSSIQIDQLRAVPRLATQLGGLRHTGFTKGWIGGGVLLDETGITWTPTDYSRRYRHMPVLRVPWSEVAAVRVLRKSGIGDPAILEIRYADGSRWTMNVRPYGSLRDALGGLPVTFIE